MRRQTGSAVLSCGLLAAVATPWGPADAAPEGPAPHEEGSLADIALRPVGTFTRLCAPEAAVCVHLPASVSHDQASEVLSVATRSLEGLAALRLPGPLPDTPRGGDGRLDVYLDGNEPTVAHGDAGVTGTGFDRASAFVVAPARGIVGCADAQQLAAAVAEAALLGRDAALEPSSLAMLADHTSTLLEPCTTREMDAIDLAQRGPERTFVGELGASGPGSFLFPRLLEEKYGTGEPGKLTFALAAIAAQRSATGPLVDEPDPFDSLRITQQANKSSLADSVLELMVARAFLGSRSDETQLADVAKYGSFGRVRFEWSVPHASLPRRLAQTRPVEPLGAAYIWLDLEGASPDAELTFLAEWEEPVAFRWALVKVDDKGSPIATLEVVPVLGQTKIEKTVRDLSGTRGLVIVGVNEGEARRDEPFDPGQPREAPHGWVVSLYR